MSTMKLFGFVVIILALHLAAASLPCNPALAYHGSDCSCGSNLPPVQYRAYAFAVRYPVSRFPGEDSPTTYDAQVQQADDATDLKKKWGELLDYQIQLSANEKCAPTTTRYQYNVQVPDQQQVQLRNLQTSISHLDGPRHANCRCEGPCRCQGPLQTFAPMDFYGAAAAPRYRRSLLDSVEREFEAPHKTKNVKPFMEDSVAEDDEFYKNLQGEDYVLERMQSRGLKK